MQRGPTAALGMRAPHRGPGYACAPPQPGRARAPPTALCVRGPAQKCSVPSAPGAPVPRPCRALVPCPCESPVPPFPTRAGSGAPARVGTRLSGCGDRRVRTRSPLAERPSHPVPPRAEARSKAHSEVRSDPP
ncbi:hypothetical protein GCM10018793_33840 [Streptomyces sulfonofaciens]|uniref:Uncharacterized protein n=1 Tax=Streptomyces sulfonofaciens TaxID=68272 RepID=A0A919L227_9ACTN|nr:hypothetical protein GCM10018793_33840 [Streptomyces sulfonofaciens]